MTLLSPGYWHSTFWPSGFWQPNSWPEWGDPTGLIQVSFDARTERAKEASAYAVDVDFADQDGEALSPDTAFWRLTDLEGTVINERSAVPLECLDGAATIVLSGDDLACPQGLTFKIALTVYGTYTTDLGAGLPFAAEHVFWVDNLVAIPAV